MPQLTYTGDEGRYYPALGLAPTPGETYELPRNPGDGNWDAAKTQAKKTHRPAPEKDEA